MLIPIVLNSPKGDYVALLNREFKAITCKSDAAQQLPKLVINYRGKLFTYHRMSKGSFFVFREREVICV